MILFGLYYATWLAICGPLLCLLSLLSTDSLAFRLPFHPQTTPYILVRLILGLADIIPSLPLPHRLASLLS